MRKQLVSYQTDFFLPQTRAYPHELKEASGALSTITMAGAVSQFAELPVNLSDRNSPEDKEADADYVKYLRVTIYFSWS